MTQDFNRLWTLFKEYHSEVARYSGEMALPNKENFVSFWASGDKWSYFLEEDKSPIGFVILQTINCPAAGTTIEVGAIYVRKENRGIQSLKLYKVAVDLASSKGLAVSSQIAGDNTHSLKIYEILKKKYSKSSEYVFTNKKIDKGRVFVTCQRKRQVLG